MFLSSLSPFFHDGGYVSQDAHFACWSTCQENSPWLQWLLPYSATYRLSRLLVYGCYRPGPAHGRLGKDTGTVVEVVIVFERVVGRVV